MSQRHDIIGLGRESATRSAQAKQVVLRPPQAQPSRRGQGARGLVGVMMRRGRRHR